MRLSNNSFPYPVLSSANSFDIDSEFKFGDSFSVNVDQVQIGQSDFELVVTYFLKNDDLQMMVNDGRAKVVAHVESTLTSYRNAIEFPENSDTVSFAVDASMIAKNIELTVLVVSNVMIEEYSNSGFNSELFGDNYAVKNIMRGDILAFEPTIDIELQTVDSGPVGVQTFIKVAKSKNKSMMVNLDGEAIKIEIPTETYRVYAQMQNAKEVKMANFSLLVPALMLAVDDIKDEGSTNGDLLLC
ncbi:hypothetical protein [Weissella cibaria]|uniref:hypothetical protein n=1 Tax=Weissella cibaria TaxID=137591 RepID=UPI0013DCC96B|nr:hypothetical protein [Weissella cibaria]NFA03254.1 hypothetical protein [Weissella cibaria]